MTLQACSTRLYNRAKTWWAWANALRVGVVVAGAAATVAGVAPLPASLVAGVLALAGWWAQYRADGARDRANDLRRQMDLQDGLGWAVSRMDLRDLGAEVGAVVSPEPPVESYFESRGPVGPRRLVENVRETGFFSEHIARTAERAMWGVTAALALLAVGGLFAAVAVIDDAEALRTAGVVLATVLLAVETTGVARLALDYGAFRRSACEVKSQADRLLDAPSVSLATAAHVAESYFLDRARAPLLPDWVYSGVSLGGVTLYAGRRDHLNRLWRETYGPALGTNE